MSGARRGPVLVSALAAVALAVVAVSLWPVGRARLPGEPETGSPAVENAVHSAAAAVPTAPPDESAPDQRTQLPLLEARSPGDAVGAHGEPLRVLVVDGVTGMPVAAAEVLVPPPSIELTPALRERVHGLPVVERTEVLGTSYRTDARGEVEVPRPESFAVVVARAPGQFGHAAWGDRLTAALRIELHRDTTLTVQVVDHDGAPRAGMPLSLRMRYAGRAVPATKWLGETAGEDGLCVCRHFQVMVATVERQEQGRPERAEVVLRGPGLDAPGVALDLDHPPPAPVVLTLPAHGTVVVRVQDERGEALHQDANVELAALPLPDSFAERVRATARAVIPAGEREHVFAPVGLGTRLSATASVQGASLGPGGSRGRTPVGGEPDGGELDAGTAMPAQEVLGPARAGDVVTVTFVAGGAVPMLCGVLREGERVLAGSEVAMLWQVGGKQISGKVDTEGDGRFALVLDARLVGGTLTSVRVELLRGERLLLATAKPDRVIERGRTDLGELVLAPAPLLLAGDVVDEAGVGIDDADLWVQPSAPLDEQALREGRLRRTLRVHVVRSAGGRFAIHGPPPDEPLVFTVQHEDYRVAPSIPFTPGRDDLRVVLRGAGIVRARVRADPELRVSALRGTLRAADGTELGFRRSRNEGVLELEARQVPPGSATFELRLLGDRQAVLSVAGVEVRAGEVSADPRLQALDLGPSLRFLEVSVVTGENDAPLDGSSVVLRDPLVPGWSEMWPGPKCRIPTCGEPRDLEVRAPGWQTRLQIVEDTTVRQAAASLVRLRLKDPPALPEGCRLHVRLAAGGVPPESSDPLVRITQMRNPMLRWSLTPESEDGAVWTFRPAPGEHHVGVFVATSDARRSVAVAGIAPARITVRDGGTMQELELSMPAVSLRAALVELRQ